MKKNDKWWCVLKSPITQGMLLLSVVYYIVSRLVPTQQLIEFCDGLGISFSLFVFVFYSKRLIISLTHRSPDVYDMLMTGIAFNWLLFALDRAWRGSARVFGIPDLINSPFVGFILVGSIFSASLHLLVKGVVDQDQASLGRGIPREAWQLIVRATVLGALLGFAAVIYGWWYHG